jgi:hypothetical protein
MFSPEKEELFVRAPKFERAFRILMQRSLAVTQERLFNTISKTATEKYLEFLDHYPHSFSALPNIILLLIWVFRLSFLVR